MKRSHLFLFWLFAGICLSGVAVQTASAQVTADIQVVETQPGVFTFSTSYTGGTNPVYVWSFGDGFQANGNPVDHAYSFAGNYQVYLQVYDTATGLLASGDTLLLVSNVTCNMDPAFTYSVQPNGTVMFYEASISQSGTIISYHWDFGDGQTADFSTSQNLQHTYTANGTYTVCLTIQDDFGCTDTMCMGVAVTLPICPQNFAQVAPSLSGTSGVFVITTPGSNAMPFSVMANYGDGSSIQPYTFTSGPYTTTHTYPQANTSYQPCFYFTDANGCMDTVCLNVYTGTCTIQPIIAYTVDTATNNASFVFTTTGGSPVSFIWNFFGATPSSSTLSNPTVNYPVPGSYDACITVADANGCTASTCEVVTIGSGCNVSPIFTSQVDPNGLAILAGTSSGGVAPLTYYWDLGDGATATGPTVTHQYVLSGNYTVCLTVIDANGCSAMTCNVVNVALSGCPSQLVNASYNTGPAGFVNYVLNSLAGALPYSVIVNYGDGSSPIGPLTMTTVLTLSYTYAIPGVYTACFFITDANGCTDTVCSVVNSNCPTMAATFTTLDLTAGAVQLTAAATGGTAPYNYTWTPSTWLSSSVGATVVSSPLSPITYCLTAVDANGCSASYCGLVSPPCAVEAEFTYTFTGSIGTASITNPVAGAQYIWIIDNTTYVGPVVDFYLNTPGIYSACVQASTGNCYDNFCDTIDLSIPNADTLSGYVWEDMDGDGFWDSGEPPMPQSLVILCQPDDTMSCQYAYTDVNGYYVFIVAPDTYEISSYNWFSTYVQTFPVSPTVYTVITTGNQNISGFDFGYQNQAITLQGCVFYDTNNNGVQDVGETGAPYQYVYVNGWWYYTNSDGCYSISLVPGTYTITYSPTVGSFYTLSTPGSYTVTATTVGQIYGGNSFGLYADPSLQNLCVNVSPWTTVTPGFPAWYYINYCNYGATPASGTVTYTWDPNLIVTNLDPAPTTQSGNTATWDFTNLAPGTCQTIYADFDAPASMVLGTFVTTGATITPIAGDINPANNIDTTHQVVVGSWDPNAKEVAPYAGLTDPDEINKLTYTVHFQNTGSAPAVNVVLVDTLSSNLDLSTFKMNGASHAYTLDFNPSTGVAQWIFNNIMLPDSGSDYHGSMGFVEYEIELLNGLVEGQTIENFADIYFDFNEAVRTNTTVNTIDFGLSVNALVENIQINVMPNPAGEYIHFVVKGLENPDYKVIVRNVLGQNVRELSSNGQKATMLRQGLVSGVYSFEIFSNQTILGTGTFVLE